MTVEMLFEMIWLVPAPPFNNIRPLIVPADVMFDIILLLICVLVVPPVALIGTTEAEEVLVVLMVLKLLELTVLFTTAVPDKLISVIPPAPVDIPCPGAPNTLLFTETELITLAAETKLIPVNEPPTVTNEENDFIWLKLILTVPANEVLLIKIVVGVGPAAIEQLFIILLLIFKVAVDNDVEIPSHLIASRLNAKELNPEVNFTLLLVIEDVKVPVGTAV